MKNGGEFPGAQEQDHLGPVLLQPVDARLEPGQDVPLRKDHGAPIPQFGDQHVIPRLRGERLDLLPGQAVQAARLEQLDLLSQQGADVPDDIIPGRLSNGDRAYFDHITSSPSAYHTAVLPRAPPGRPGRAGSASCHLGQGSEVQAVHDGPVDDPLHLRQQVPVGHGGGELQMGGIHMDQIDVLPRCQVRGRGRPAGLGRRTS